MSTTYPKGKSHPSSAVGECHTTTWPESTSTSYPGSGAASTAYNGDKCKTKVCTGGGGSKSGKTYPKRGKSSSQFGTGGFR